MAGLHEIDYETSRSTLFDCAAITDLRSATTTTISTTVVSSRNGRSRYRCGYFVAFVGVCLPSTSASAPARNWLKDSVNS